ncbi:protein-tyrosine phosphatase-like protein [Pyrenochaeta sp. MPI-SDFR-AT-0127]|nr:protein-tyrosine phosphatase-like protein [Pyrenochaeta sp. MPI-SDFR-AT-0127]
MTTLAFASPNPAQIEDVPGLYISDITIPSSPAQLQEHGITHVLTLMTNRSRPKIPADLCIVHKFVEIDDDALSDILVHLEEACKFIDNALLSPANHSDATTENENCSKEVKVLVHCLQGMSRSGAVVVAYLMRRLSLTFASALERARLSRPIITLNHGFAEQLDLWQRMDFDIHDDQGREKALYKAWKSRRDGKLAMGEVESNKERTKSMASMAARFGARRLELQRKGLEDDEVEE